MGFIGVRFIIKVAMQMPEGVFPRVRSRFSGLDLSIQK